jgi:chromosome segregation and condensation protein ScpB
MSLTRVIEALLFSAQKPLSIHEITAAIKAAEGDSASETPNEFARVKNAEVAAALEQLKVEYIQQSRAFQPALRNGSGSFSRRRSRRV